MSDELKVVKEKLKECKPEWLEQNARGQNSLGVWTVQQILDNAVEGITTWDFIIEDQWREEVSRYDKQSRNWIFDGYVYHVKGALIIEGVGKRTQFGVKVGIGGKDNQASAYKAAASDCLKKCASLFGVGSSIYSKIIIESDEPVVEQEYNQQTQQAQQAQQIQHPNGVIQQGEWFWVNNQWIHQSEYVAMQQQQQLQNGQGGHYPQPGLNEEQQTMQAIDYANQQANNPQSDFPFENVQTSEGQPAEQQNFQATPQQEAQPQNYEAIQYGAPIGEQKEEKTNEEVTPPKVEKEDPLANVEANNPWDTPENRQQIETFHQHKTRLNIKNDGELLPHIRDYFKDENAGLNNITPETLVGFNLHLQSIQA